MAGRPTPATTRSPEVAVGQSSGAPVATPTLRLATDEDLGACAAIWRTSINDYTNRLNLPEIPDDLAAVLRLYGHLRSTDPDGFVVAEQRRRDRRTADRRVRVGAATRSALVPVDAVRAAGVSGQGPRADADRPGDAGGRDRVAGDLHRQRPADLERALRVARDGTAHAAPAARRPARSTGRTATASRGHPGHPVRRDPGRSSRRTERERPRRRAGRHRSRGGRLRPSAGSRHGPARGADRVPVYRGWRPARLATATPRRPGASARSRFATPPCSIR